MLPLMYPEYIIPYLLYKRLTGRKQGDDTKLSSLYSWQVVCFIVTSLRSLVTGVK